MFCAWTEELSSGLELPDKPVAAQRRFTCLKNITKLNQELQMSVLRKNLIFWSCLIAAFLLLGRSSFSETAISEQTLSTDMVIKEVFQPGSGLPVGKITSVMGEALIFHRDPAVGYRAQSGLPLYIGDVIRTWKTAWILCRLSDGSDFTLAPETTLTILQCNLNTALKTSLSFLDLKTGGARFKLNPLTELSSYEFKVQTAAAFVHSKEGDFIIKANPAATEIIAFEKSRLEVTATAAPEEAIFLSDYQRTVVGEGMVSKTVEPVSRENAEAMMAEFHLIPRINPFVPGPKTIHEDEIDNETQGEETP
jgi:hypothetical protein